MELFVINAHGKRIDSHYSVVDDDLSHTGFMSEQASYGLNEMICVIICVKSYEVRSEKPFDDLLARREYAKHLR